MIGAQWGESDTVLHKLVQSWDRRCLDVQFVPAQFASLPSKHAPTKGDGRRATRGVRVCARAYMRACAYSPMSHNACTCVDS